MAFARGSFIAGSFAALAFAPAIAGEEQLVFPNGQTSVRLPATFYPPHIVVRANIAGRGLDFLIDTGANRITLNPKIAAELGLQTYNNTSTVIARRVDIARAIVPEIRIADVIVRDADVNVAPIEEYPAIGVRVVGLIGGNFFRKVGLTLDYRNRRVTVVPAAAFDPPAASDNTVVMPIDLSHDVPVVAAKINGAAADRVIVDTGAVSDMLLFEYFGRRNPQALAPEVAKPIVFPKMVKMSGIGGTFDYKYYRLKRVELGDLYFDNFEAAYVTSEGAYPYDADGLIGPGILANFTVTFDYAGGKMYLSVK
jgi:predicted aspartyl protease